MSKFSSSSLNQISIQSIAESMFHDFVSTWISSSTLTTSEVSESILVLTTLINLGVLFLFSVLVTLRLDDQEKKKKVFQKDLMDHHHSVNLKIPHRSTVLRVKSSVENELSLLNQSFPQVFRSNTFWNKFKNEMKVYHRWLGIVFYYSPVYPRSLRVVSLFSSIVIMLFIQSVTYNIAAPDDGSCESQDTESGCLSLKSTLNSNENRCYWTNTVNYLLPQNSSEMNVSEGNCSFRPVDGSVMQLFTITLISAVLSAPFSLSIDFVLRNLLCQQTLSSNNNSTIISPGHSNTDTKVHSTRRTLVPDTEGGLKEKSGDNLQEDFKNLLLESKEYLVKGHLGDKARKEFEGELS